MHNSPFDRGAADSYYQRGAVPHYYADGKRVQEEQMTLAEIAEYYAGYDQNEVTQSKEWEF